MELVVVGIGLVVLLAIAATALGQAWGPLLLAIGFGGLAALFLASGYRSPGPEIGVAYLGASVSELAAANEYWNRHEDSGGPDGAWRFVATGIGLAGTVGFVGVLFLLARAIVGYYSLL